MNRILPSSTDVTDLVLQRVYKKGGCIKKFILSPKECTFTIDGCRAEEIVYDMSCSVSLENSTALTASFYVQKKVVQEFDFALNCKEFCSLLYKKFIENGIFISLENKGNKVCARLLVGLDKIPVVLKCFAVCNDEGFFHENFLCLESSSSSCFVRAEFSAGVVTSSSVMQLLASYSELFEAGEFIHLDSYTSQKNNQNLSLRERFLKKRKSILQKLGITALVSFILVFTSCVSQKQNKTSLSFLLKSPYSVEHIEPIKNERTGQYDRVEFSVCNFCEDAICSFEICFSVFDSAGKSPFIDDDNDFIFSVDCFIEKGQTEFFCVEITNVQELLEPYVIDFVYIRKIEYITEKKWSDPYGMYCVGETY